MLDAHHGDLHDLPELGIVAVSATAPGLMLSASGPRPLPWHSVALDFHRIDPEPVRQLQGLALPPVQSRGIAMIAAGHLLRLREGNRFFVAVENSPSPRAPRPGELNDGQFLCEVAQAADCGIVLDLDRPLPVCGNSRRGVLSVFNALPAQRVIAVRIGERNLERHRALLAAVVGRLPRLRAILVTRVGAPGDQGEPAATLSMGSLEAIWRRRGRACRQPGGRLLSSASRKEPAAGPPTPYPDGFSRSSRPGSGRRQRGPYAYLQPG